MFSASRRSRRALPAAALAVGLTLLGAGPASAHVEATAEGAQAGTGPVTVVFSAAAESSTAGIVSAKVQLPAGLTPQSTTLAAAPGGWALTPTSDGYEVAGPDIGPGVDLEYSITIDQLPADATEFPFKTLLRYSDGVEDAWIEIPTADNPEPENPAPTITVAPAPPGAASSSAPPTESTSPSSPATESTPSETQAADPEPAASQDDSGTSTGLVVAVAVVVAAAVAGGLWFWRSRKSSGV